MSCFLVRRLLLRQLADKAIPYPPLYPEEEGSPPKRCIPLGRTAVYGVSCPLVGWSFVSLPYHLTLFIQTTVVAMKLHSLRAWGRRALVALLLGSATPLVAQQYFPNGDPSTPDEHGARWVFGGLVSFWQDNKAKTTTFDFSPEVGYLFNENWGLGVVGTYQYQKGNGESESLWALRPFARYYYMHSEPFNLYLDGGFGFSTSGGVKGWEVGLRPGACVDLTKGLCLCLRLGFIGYRDKFGAGEEAGLSSSGFGLRFAPEELQIGLELEL